MKIEFKTDDNNRAIGYDLVPENETEQKQLGTVRNLLFFGFDDTHIEYDGMEHNEKTNMVERLKFIQKKHQKN